MDRALSLACDADVLIEASHYAVDSILPKCSELRVVCEEISGVLNDKKAHLLKAMELHQCLEKVLGPPYDSFIRAVQDPSKIVNERLLFLC